ncbi:MAG: ATP-binding cassette domain-containing protein [Candidatus Krumholzibacteria bacterium]|jgi:ABC-2 type transport system ATP-binding protein|nr:ATP-binding cassette domain-containing protein [Candidatus Krumholzibacteria bacterium]MDP6796449.1 ATP-binding cassette domain-containing protein [Candidatus Krumholzibacteria bacterium]MDP7022471.1 ATP-binding cassette domain-containing protein [Candidatus Krumholzibacteria bacterium]
MIEVQSVSKRFGQTLALDKVSMKVERGEILGFLGPNGAGKSTAMKIITSYLAADEGRVLVDGVDVSEKPLEIRARIGYMPENVPLYPDMRVHEYLRFAGEARGLKGGALSARASWVVEACHLEPVYKKPILELSKGYKQRTGLAQALIHDPEILILDEPTSGLDPLQIIGIRELIQSLGKTKTILFSTHILQEVAPVTDRVVIVNQGRIVADGRIGDLQREAMKSNRIFIAFEQVPGDLVTGLEAQEGIERVSALDSNRFEVRGSFDTDLPGLLSKIARKENWELRELNESPYSLEDTFIELTRDDGEVRA